MSFDGHSFNIIKHRDGPTKVILKSGHKVTKENYIYFQAPNADASAPGDWMMVKCADYHGEHFVYLDPLYNTDALHADPDKRITGRGHWFAMCSCGSPAVVVGPTEAAKEDSDCPERLLVCYTYHLTLNEYGFGTHADEEGRRRWT